MRKRAASALFIFVYLWTSLSSAVMRPDLAPEDRPNHLRQGEEIRRLLDADHPFYRLTIPALPESYRFMSLPLVENNRVLSMEASADRLADVILSRFPVQAQAIARQVYYWEYGVERVDIDGLSNFEIEGGLQAEKPFVRIPDLARFPFMNKVLLLQAALIAAQRHEFAEMDVATGRRPTEKEFQIFHAVSTQLSLHDIKQHLRKALQAEMDTYLRESAATLTLEIRDVVVQMRRFFIIEGPPVFHALRWMEDHRLAQEGAERASLFSFFRRISDKYVYSQNEPESKHPEELSRLMKTQLEDRPRQDLFRLAQTAKRRGDSLLYKTLVSDILSPVPTPQSCRLLFH